MEQNGLRYEQIGLGYSRTRREDPALKRQIERALGDARTVLNVGAGAGSYEPADRDVIALEPSAVMVMQRDRRGPPAVRALAQQLPFRDSSVDAAMAILSLHHWHPDQEPGVLEMCRVARREIVIATVDPAVSGQMWLMADYLHEVAELDNRIMPLPQTVAAWIGGDVATTIVPVPRDTPDWTLMSFWGHPERVLDAGARNATSGFARQSPDVVRRVVADVKRDLASGAWDARHGHLRELPEYDAGLRLIVARLP